MARWAARLRGERPVLTVAQVFELDEHRRTGSDDEGEDDGGAAALVPVG